MFDATTGAAQKGRKKDPVSAALSVLLHVVVVVGIVWIGTKEVIEKPREATEVTFFSAPPPPPPPPKAKKKKKKKKKKVEKIEIKPDELVQPDEIPEETPEEVEEEVEEDEEEDEDEDDGPEGVEGGEEGGVEGGKVGGVKGGVEGGKVGSVGSDGLCKPPTWTPEYPETIDKGAGIYGTFIVRGLSGRDGKWAKRKDPMCEQAAGLDKKTLRQYWHPNKCIFAESIEPKLQPLVYTSVMHFAAIRCKAYINTAGQPWATWWRLPYNYIEPN